MNVLFINYHDFTSNSAVHIFNLANELDSLGVASAVAVPDQIETVNVLGNPRFTPLDFEKARGGRFGFRDGRPPDLIHTWTPREGVRKLTLELSSRYSCPYIVHLEDNEDVIAADQMGFPRESLLTADERELDRRVTDSISHPQRSREFVAGAAGATVIIDRLLDFVPKHVPSLLLWPAFEKDLFVPQPPSSALRDRLGIRAGNDVVVYAGNVHATNASEARSLYLAVALLNRRGLPVKLVRLGRDYVEFLGADKRLVDDQVIQVGFQPRSDLPQYYALATALVQPGRSDAFNDYRFPSKLPEFFAMGLPVVLPPTNVGHHTTDEQECLLLNQGDALDIARKLERIFRDDRLAKRLGAGARKFAERSFSWKGGAENLREFYGSIARPSQLELERATERYREFEPAHLGYATVRDYCDSADSLPYLATLNGDMKDVQRPWTLKAILGTVPTGGRLLEIGAGEPHVADVLARMGYHVTVVDPYDGRDRGPSSADAIAAAYPHLNVVRGVFPNVLDDRVELYDCVYSISVLEHVPTDEVSAVCNGLLRFTKPGGRTIHAIDHVLLGSGDRDHFDRLRRIVSLLGLSQQDLDMVLEQLECDADTYFLSAEAHNRWRGKLTYDEFPMRRCVSIELCMPVPVSKTSANHS